jgi:hypothetical protein
MERTAQHAAHLVVGLAAYLQLYWPQLQLPHLCWHRSCITCGCERARPGPAIRAAPECCKGLAWPHALHLTAQDYAGQLSLTACLTFVQSWNWPWSRCCFEGSVECIGSLCLPARWRPAAAAHSGMTCCDGSSLADWQVVQGQFCCLLMVGMCY